MVLTYFISCDFMGVDSITRLMLHLNDCGVKAPRPLKSVNGKYICKVHLPDESGQEETFAVRLFTFIPGKVFKDAPYTDSLLFQLGITAGKLSKALSVSFSPRMKIYFRLFLSLHHA